MNFFWRYKHSGIRIQAGSRAGLRESLAAHLERGSSLLTTYWSGSISSHLRCFWWTGLAPWQFEFPFSGSLISTFLAHLSHTMCRLNRFSKANSPTPGLPLGWPPVPLLLRQQSEFPALTLSRWQALILGIS